MRIAPLHLRDEFIDLGQLLYTYTIVLPINQGLWGDLCRRKSEWDKQSGYFAKLLAQDVDESGFIVYT